MGLIDVLNGMQNGPRGARGSGGSDTSSGGMSPITMAILGLLAYKAFKSFTSQPGATVPSGAPAPGSTQAGGSGGIGDILKGALGGGQASPQAGGGGGGLGDILKNVLGGGGPAPTQAGGAGGAGGLGDILKGPLGGLLGGAAAGTVLSGGLNDLLKQLQDAGQGDVTKSWVGNGPNKQISSGDLAKALGADQINTLAAHSGLSRDDLLASLSQYLPQVVDHLTPDGRVPTEREITRSL